MELSDIVSVLKKEKLLTGKETKMDATLIGGINGVKYKDNAVEIYEYDITSDAYKEIVRTNKVVLDGFNMEIDVDAINGKFILFSTDDKVIETFKKIK